VGIWIEAQANGRSIGMSQQVRVRFAPSPTGYLHVGGARTALFNWLYARHFDGKFILRIEDTDLVRSTDESTRAILEGLSWLGLDWDEGPGKGGDYGPYFQTQRKDLYLDYAKKLVAQGKAYWCFCTADELEARRKEAKAAGLPPRYDGKCRELSEEEVARRLAEGESATIRMKVAETGSTWVSDLIRGDVEFQNEVLDDFVIIKSDGMAAYNFAVVIDDALMKISHVIRGEDHLSNTPKQIQIYQALGFPIPEFAHIPMILGSDRARLSKRHGATAVTQYQEEGYLAEAMVNYLALLGWSYDGTQTLFSQKELVDKFTLKKVSRNPAIFDGKKLTWMNGQYLRELSPEEFFKAALPFLEQAALPLDKYPHNWLLEVLGSYQTRIELLSQLPEAVEFFFHDPESYDEAAVAKHWKNGKEDLEGLKELLSSYPVFEEEPLEEAFRTKAKQEGKKLGQLIHPLRLALCGKSISPGIFQVLVLLGKEIVLRRIERALAYLEEMGTN
jgi:glutamyl-tRNA synthetase